MRLVNSITLNMIQDQVLEMGGSIHFTPQKEGLWTKEGLAEWEAKGKLVSYIGHPDLAALLGVKCNRETIKVGGGTTLLVAQYLGERLPEGCKDLPEGSKIKFFRVDIFAGAEHKPHATWAGREEEMIAGTSAYGEMMRAAKKVADLVQSECDWQGKAPEVKAMEDQHGNLLATIQADHFYGYFWDE